MQNMHKTTNDRPLTGVHGPIHRSSEVDLSTSTGGRTHRGAGWRTEAIIHITTRGLDRIIDSTICPSLRVQEAMDHLRARTAQVTWESKSAARITYNQYSTKLAEFLGI